MIDKRMLLVFPSPIMRFEVSQMIPKGTQAGPPAHQIGFHLITTTPIDLKPNDRIWIDSRNGQTEIIERNGIVIYRRAWLN